KTLVSWALVVPFAAWTLVRAFGAENSFPLIQIIAFTPYAAIPAALAGAGAVALRCWSAALTASASVVLLLVLVLPRAFGGPDAPISGPAIQVLTVNM